MIEVKWQRIEPAEVWLGTASTLRAVQTPCIGVRMASTANRNCVSIQVSSGQVFAPTSLDAKSSNEVVRVHEYVHNRVQHDGQEHIPAVIEAQDTPDNQSNGTVVEQM